MYTTPFSTMAFALNAPYGRTPTAAFPVSLNVHACASVDTFAFEIVDPVASRVFARSPFEYGHTPEAVAVRLVAACVVTVLHPARAAALCPPQAARSKPATTVRTAESVMVRGSRNMEPIAK